MKISILAKKSEIIHSSIQAVKSITDAARARDVSVTVVDLTDLNNIDQWLNNLGDVVIYRSATIVNNAAERCHVFKLIKSKRIIINDIIIKYPLLRWKDWQQEFISSNTTVQTIPTWRFDSVTKWHQAVNNQELPFPLIQKPRGGIMGRDVHLLKRPTDLLPDTDMKRYIWQPYIPNQGDYRIILIDGSVIGTMYRQAAAGRITNNIEQGGIGSLVTDSAIADQISHISLEIQQALPLDVVGVDLIQNDSTGIIYFLEFNISPQWAEFEKVTNVSVGDKIIDLCQHRYRNL